MGAQTTDPTNTTLTQQPVVSAQPQPVVGPAAAPTTQKVMKEFPESKSTTKHTALLIVGAVLVVMLGVGTGWFLSGSSVASSGSTDVAPGAEMSATEAGVDDEETFPDTAEGLLVVGSIEGEGTHYLDRDAGETKYVFLTSTVIDLERFVDKKVQVWGETIAAQDAPWLMDVGKIKVLE